MKQEYDVIIIGGGASGLISAVTAASRGKTVLLLEKTDRPGRKILASGNGRCNLMNSGTYRYYGDAEFAIQVMKQCPQSQLIHFFRHWGLMLTEESQGRIYPVTFQSASVVNMFRKALETVGVSSLMNCHVTSVHRFGKMFSVQTDHNLIYKSPKVIIACGGAAQSKLGGTYDGYHLLKSFGHKMIPVIPSLVPLKTDARSISGLAGIRIRCGVRLIRNNFTIHREEGELLFTDYGISGICIMQCARFADFPNTRIELNLLRYSFNDIEDTIKELIRRRSLFSNSSPVWLLNGILPEKLAYAVLKQSGLPLRGETCSNIDDSALEKIAYTAFCYRIEIYGTKEMEFAQVSAGGIDCSDFDPVTMESHLISGLYAAGEVLNVDGDCGGFNLMFAFASGMNAGKSV